MIRQPERYERHTEPYAHQLTEANNTWNIPARGVFWDMGTGKSKLMIDTIGMLYCAKEIDGAILIGDKGNYRNWAKQIKEHLHPKYHHRIAVWTSAPDRYERAALNDILVPKDDCLDFLLINVESLSSDRSAEWANRFINTHYPLICLDEATSIKNHRAQRTKTAISLARRCEYRRVMTGTPITQSPLDVFSIFEFLGPAMLGFRNYTAFKSYFAIVQRINLGPGRPQFDQIIGYRNLDQLTEMMSEHSSRITKDECLDLPPKVYEQVEVELTPEQAKAYRDLKSMALLQLEQGQLTSTSALTTLNKLQQIVAGHVKLDSGEVVTLPSNRIDTLLNTLDEIGDRKVVIWCAFQEDVRQIMARLKELKKPAVDYYGETADKDREANLTAFVEHDAQYFVATAATGGKGLNGLTVASHQIYFSNDFNLERRLQSEDRLHRIGQKCTVVIIDLVARKTTDEKILGSHHAKQDIAHQVLDNIGKILKDDLTY